VEPPGTKSRRGISGGESPPPGGLEDENPSLANSIFEKDYLVNQMRAKATDAIASAIIRDSSPEFAKQMLRMQDIFRKLERTGDHIKNIAEEIIFYIDAKVIRHKGKV
jgi:phosphate transport system protein